jgi:hypothetical protein
MSLWKDTSNHDNRRVNSSLNILPSTLDLLHSERRRMALIRSYNQISGENLYPDFTVRVCSKAPMVDEPEVVLYATEFSDEQLKQIKVVDGNGETWSLDLPF